MKASVMKIGDETVIVVSAGAVVSLGLTVGQHLRARRLTDGALIIGPYDPRFDKAIRIAEKMMDEYTDTFTELAKS
jgi:hypothetical protein